MAGTGNAVIHAKIKKLLARTAADVTFGNHMATHMALGLLFLGGGTHTFKNDNRSVALLLCSFYPAWPTTIHDNRVHLQALRHLWALVAEKRCLVTVDVDTGEVCSVPVTLTCRKYYPSGPPKTLLSGLEPDPFSDFSEVEHVTMMTPCLLPWLDLIDDVQVTSPRYWHRVVLKNGLVEKGRVKMMAVKRKHGHLNYVMVSGCLSMSHNLYHQVSLTT